MTTIAYKHGVMAADSRAYGAGLGSIGSKLKIRRLPDGRLIGATTPQVGAGEAILDWYAAGADVHNTPEGVKRLQRRSAGRSSRRARSGGVWRLDTDRHARKPLFCYRQRLPLRGGHSRIRRDLTAGCRDRLQVRLVLRAPGRVPDARSALPFPAPPQAGQVAVVGRQEVQDYGLAIVAAAGRDNRMKGV